MEAGNTADDIDYEWLGNVSKAHPCQPEDRRRGLAAAALPRHYHRMKALGATHMTGGGDLFYEKIGYGKDIHWTFWKREEPQADAPLTNPCQAAARTDADYVYAYDLWVPASENYLRIRDNHLEDRIIPNLCQKKLIGDLYG